MELVKLFPPLDFANVREGPGTQFPIVGRVYPGDIAFWIRKHENGWNEVIFNPTTRRTGWLFPNVATRSLEKWNGHADFYDELSFPVDPNKPLNQDGWPGEWYDATGFARYYTATGVGAYHTGADLNLKNNADKDYPIQAIHDGEVLHAGNYPVWGNIIVVRHGFNSNGIRIRSRYAHMETIAVKRGDTVGRGDEIGTVGDAFGRYSHHLHFDISPTDILDTRPTHWPGNSKRDVLLHYEDPSKWIIKSRS